MSAHEAGDNGNPGKNMVKVKPTILAHNPHWSGWLALLLAIVALILVVAGWVNFERLQHAQIALFNAGLQTQKQQLDALTLTAAPRSELDNDINTTQQTLKSFSERLDSMDAALTDLRRRSEQGRDAWIKAEAASLLMAANDQVQLNANPGLALQALAAADERLKLLSDPQLIPVRQQIAREETALRAVPHADVTGMAAILTSLSESVSHWPLRRVAPERYTPGQQNDKQLRPSMTLWSRFKAGLERLVKDIFTVHHRQTSIEPLLEPQQEYFLRQNLQLRLAAARAALLERDNAAFQSSAQMAGRWLEVYFNTQDNGVKTAIDALAKMQQQQINPPLPDISASLALLRHTEPGRDKAP
ncbi:MAG TPA: uroporphyrinogen-III C-methyltransferase [Gammaproteobacteria bacterium]|nr:uroporphyrinogen-III C-methyltransferase [Gammaproteobacteria bacterium]